MKYLLGAALLAGGISTAAAAAPDFGHLEAYYIPQSTLDAGGGSDEDGDGLGARLRFGLGSLFFASAGFQKVTLDNVDASISESRFGLGLHHLFGESFHGYIQAQQAQFKASGGGSTDKDSGFGGTLGFIVGLGEHFTLNGQAGRFALDTSDVDEYFLGFGVPLTRGFGLFADYRIVKYSDDSSTDLDQNEVRVGLRFTTGSGGDSGGGDDYDY